jgi:hypothetical protein
MSHTFTQGKGRFKAWITLSQYKVNASASLLQIRDSTLALVEKMRKFGVSCK